MQVTAGSLERGGQTQAGAPIGDSHDEEEKRRATPRAPLRIQNGQAGFSWAAERGRPGLRARQRLPCAQMGAQTQVLRPIWAAACGCGQHLPVRRGGDRTRVGTGKERNESTGGQKGPTGVGPGLTLAW